MEAASFPRNWKLKLQSTNAFTSDRATNGTGPSERDEISTSRTNDSILLLFTIQLFFGVRRGDKMKNNDRLESSQGCSPREAKSTSKRDFYAPFPPFRLCFAQCREGGK